MAIRLTAAVVSISSVLGAAACSNEDNVSAMSEQPKLSIDVELPPAVLTMRGMTLLSDEEVEHLLVGKKVADGAVSHYSNYLPGRIYVRELDLGIIQTGIYEIAQNAVCNLVALDHAPRCFRFYRAQDDAIFVSHVGSDGPPSRLKIVGPITIR